MGDWCPCHLHVGHSAMVYEKSLGYEEQSRGSGVDVARSAEQGRWSSRDATKSLSNKRVNLATTKMDSIVG